MNDRISKSIIFRKLVLNIIAIHLANVNIIFEFFYNSRSKMMEQIYKIAFQHFVNSRSCIGNVNTMHFSLVLTSYQRGF